CARIASYYDSTYGFAYW
nr:immunoglobulin heavy chain junction region [Mus musculus]